MKLMYINTLYSPYLGGGAEITLQSIVEGMKNLGHEVVVVTTGDNLGIVEEIINGVRVLRVGIANVYWQYNNEKPPIWKRALWHLLDIYNLRMGHHVKEIIKSEQPDNIICHNLAGFSASTWSAIDQSGVPLTQVLHDLYNLCPNSNMFKDGHSCEKQCLKCKTFRLLTPLVSNKVDAVIGVSQFILDRHLAYGLFKNAAIKRTIHNARPISPKFLNYKKRQIDKVRFGFIGTLTTAKGIELLLDVFTTLSLPNSELLIAGKGKDEYEQELKKKESSTVQFLGYSKPNEFFPKIDILIVPSIWNDTLPGVVFESLAYGVPVIGSRRGGIPEMITEGENGFLFEPENPEELAEKMKYFVERPAEIGRMGGIASEYAAPYLDVETWLKKYEELYHKVSLSKAIN